MLPQTSAELQQVVPRLSKKTLHIQGVAAFQFHVFDFAVQLAKTPQQAGSFFVAVIDGYFIQTSLHMVHGIHHRAGETFVEQHLVHGVLVMIGIAVRLQVQLVPRK